MKESSRLVIRAVRTKQAEHEVYAFFLRGSQLLQLADISRLTSAGNGVLEGFQRPRIRDQVRAIASYLNSGPVLFPSAIILALASDSRYVESRGPRPVGCEPGCDAGTLSIPLISGRTAAWIVDGQQRSLALSENVGADITVPIIAFVSESIAVQREQFILVNKSKPLGRRFVDELLPEVEFELPRDLATRRIPSYFCTALNDVAMSPFRGLIKRPSLSRPDAVVTDSSLLRVIKRSMQDPRGALAQYVSPDGSCDLEPMLRTLLVFWTAVKNVFPDAWGLPPDRSRLMHSAGIEAMGFLMDQVMGRKSRLSDPESVQLELEKMAGECHWTRGRWIGIDREWNDLQSTPNDVKLLASQLVSLHRMHSSPQ